jgi:hypothetical protein
LQGDEDRAGIRHRASRERQVVVKKRMISATIIQPGGIILKKSATGKKAPQLADDGTPLVLTFGQGKTGQGDRFNRQGRR